LHFDGGKNNRLGLQRAHLHDLGYKKTSTTQKVEDKIDFIIRSEAKI
jgi:hypothetical protein